MKRKINKTIIVVIALILTMPLFTACRNFGVNGVTITPDWQLAAVVRERAIYAQYLPDEQNLVATSIAPQSIVGTSAINANDNTSLSLDEFNTLIADIGSIWHPYQAEFSILDVRDIVIHMAERVAVFDEWFRYRGGTNEHAPSAISDGDFFMSMDSESGHIEIIQVIPSTHFVWNAELGKPVGIEEFRNGTLPMPTPPPGYPRWPCGNDWPIVSEIVMRISYFFDSEGREVVEMEKTEFLNFIGEVYVLRRKVLRNVENTSFTRYISTRPHVSQNVQGGGYFSTDLYTDNPYGSTSNFLHIDYEDPYNISFLLMGQALASKYNRASDTGFVQHLHLSDGILSVVESDFAFLDLDPYGNSYYGSAAIFRNPARTIFSRDVMAVVPLSWSQHRSNSWTTRSSDEITKVTRWAFETDSFNAISTTALSFVEGLGISNQNIINIANSLGGDEALLDARVWEFMNLVIAYRFHNSFLVNNYQDGMQISNYYWRGDDITEYLHAPPNWDAA